MKWITREHPHVDRVACPWLIARFIDPSAEFIYAPPGSVLTEAKRLGATPFDVPGVQLGHHGDECSFDAVVRHHHLDNDPALTLMARIVRGADTGRPELSSEIAGVQAILEGLRTQHYPNDHAQREAAAAVLEALYRYCQVQAATA